MRANSVKWPLNWYQWIILWSWALSETLSNYLSNEIESIIVWNRSWKHDKFEAFSYDDFPEFEKKSFAVIATAGNMVAEIAQILSDKDIPTVFASSDFSQKDLKNTKNTKLISPNLALAVVEFQQIIESLKSFKGLKLTIRESHQPGKKDKSGTAVVVRDSWNYKKGKCEVYDEEEYKSNKWITNFWWIISYRWKKYSQKLWIDKDHIWSHAYHEYNISGNMKNDKQQEKINILFKKLKKWHRKYYNSHPSLMVDVDLLKDWIQVVHRVYGRELYGDGLLKMLPWFLEQEEWKLYNTFDYLN